jgi:RecG-like helicase
MKLRALLLLIVSLNFFGCSKSTVTVEVVRHPSLTFDFNNSSSWKADNTLFEAVTKVVVYPNDTTSQAILYNRLTLKSAGHANTGENLQFIVNFDVIDQSELVGEYTPVYTVKNGLADAKLYDLTNANNLSAYNLCYDNVIKSKFQIQRQNKQERLISGIFQMTVCNTRDSTQKISITNGTFTDIRY